MTNSKAEIFFVFILLCGIWIVAFSFFSDFGSDELLLKFNTSQNIDASKVDNDDNNNVDKVVDGSHSKLSQLQVDHDNNLALAKHRNQQRKQKTTTTVKAKTKTIQQPEEEQQQKQSTDDIKTKLTKSNDDNNNEASFLQQFNSKLQQADSDSIQFEKDTLTDIKPSQILLLGMHHSVINYCFFIMTIIFF
jgi:cytoskeletal protein RodZ